MHFLSRAFIVCCLCSIMPLCSSIQANFVNMPKGKQIRKHEGAQRVLRKKEMRHKNQFLIYNNKVMLCFASDVILANAYLFTDSLFL